MNKEHYLQYDEKITSNYFSTPRHEILEYIPSKVDKVLDIGCGSGATISLLKNKSLCKWACGIDICNNVDKLDLPNIDQFIVGDIETIVLDFDDNSFDVILCLDVLEHLIDPWLTVKKLVKLLKPNGCLIASVPNVRSIRVLIPLIFLGDWKYRDSGILDKTHLRFFTKSTTLKLFDTGALYVDDVVALRDNSNVINFFNLLSFKIFTGFLVPRYLFKCIKFK